MKRSTSARLAAQAPGPTLHAKTSFRRILAMLPVLRHHGASARAAETRARSPPCL